ncbi:MAG: hypothetical protein ACLRPT_03000 [Akkermansia muciniphila]
MALVGACLGFLWHNCYPARVFMGDTGSLALGGAFGMAASARRRTLFIVIGASSSWKPGPSACRWAATSCATANASSPWPPSTTTSNSKAGRKRR